MVQIARFTRAPIVHTVELLDWATGGPMPPALGQRRLRQPKRAPAPSDQSHPGGSPSAADPNPTAIW
jgi:glycolate oxidase iron-sulfur subunit